MEATVTTNTVTTKSVVVVMAGECGNRYVRSGGWVAAVTTEGSWIAIIHHDCGGIAFYYTERPQPFAPMLSELARHTDGSAVEPHDEVICDTCHVRISVLAMNLSPDGGWG